MREIWQVLYDADVQEPTTVHLPWLRWCSQRCIFDSFFLKSTFSSLFLLTSSRILLSLSLSLGVLLIVDRSPPDMNSHCRLKSRWLSGRALQYCSLDDLECRHGKRGGGGLRTRVEELWLPIQLLVRKSNIHWHWSPECKGFPIIFMWKIALNAGRKSQTSLWRRCCYFFKVCGGWVEGGRDDVLCESEN